MTITPQTPFGALITPTTEHFLAGIPAPLLKDEIARYGLLILRGFAPLSGEAFRTLAATLGEILEFEFGAINHLEVRPNAKNSLFTNSAVPFHWEGAFIGRIPHYIFFACESAPPLNSKNHSNNGGETTFVDTTALLARLSPAERAHWEDISITYSTEKMVHYGGQFTAPLLSQHPVDGREILRYAEPVDDLNPVRQEIHGIPEAEHAAFVERLRTLLYDPAHCYAHTWQSGDFVIADNFALLHGRYGFHADAPRHIRRVNVR